MAVHEPLISTVYAVRPHVSDRLLYRAACTSLTRCTGSCLVVNKCATAQLRREWMVPTVHSILSHCWQRPLLKLLHYFRYIYKWRYTHIDFLLPCHFLRKQPCAQCCPRDETNNFLFFFFLLVLELKQHYILRE